MLRFFFSLYYNFEWNIRPLNASWVIYITAVDKHFWNYNIEKEG